MANRRGNRGHSGSFPLLGLQSTQVVTAAIELRRLLLGRKAVTNLDHVIKKQRHHFTNKGPCSQGYCLSSGHVWLQELGHKEG